MKFKLTLLLICFSLYSWAQLKSTDLIGSWKVVDVVDKNVSKATDKKAIAILRPNLMKTTIRFDAVGHGKFHFPMTGVPISESSKPSEEVHWTFDEEKQLVVIREWKERRGTIIQFVIKQEDKNVYFIIDDVPVWMKMQKT